MFCIAYPCVLVSLLPLESLVIGNTNNIYPSLNMTELISYAAYRLPPTYRRPPFDEQWNK